LKKVLSEVKSLAGGNPDLRSLLGSKDDALINDAAWLLFEQALLIEGLFVQRLNRVLGRAV